MLTIAHRGASALYPENTLRAFIAAAALGADMCEFDVRTTRDGEVVVIHDATVNRTTDGRGRVAAMSAAAIGRLDAGVRFGAEFRGARIPTLAEVAVALGERRCGMDVELKARGLERRVCEVLRGCGAMESAIVSSFDWEQLKIVAAQEPGLRLALLGEKAPAALLEAALAMDVFAIAPRFDIADAALCTAAHRRGLAVYVWTVDDEPTMRRLLAAGVDGIMTNDPKHLCEVAAS
ncbi:MAG TPA: glycerophosphodiester phosphodiesterase family protein [Candidatus Binataceae bacterium]|nr:glycerophosphodiester phosphodiesterase family protein [Candidatus Binataceae bacterium]